MTACFSLGRSLPWTMATRRSGEHLLLEAAAVLLGGLHTLLVLLVYRGADDIHLPPLGHLLADKAIQPPALVLPHQIGGHRGPPGGSSSITDRSRSP